MTSSDGIGTGTVMTKGVMTIDHLLCVSNSSKCVTPITSFNSVCDICTFNRRGGRERNWLKFTQEKGQAVDVNPGVPVFESPPTLQQARLSLPAGLGAACSAQPYFAACAVSTVSPFLTLHRAEGHC